MPCWVAKGCLAFVISPLELALIIPAEWKIFICRQKQEPYHVQIFQYITKICSTHLQRPNWGCYFLPGSDPEDYQSGVFLNLWLKQGPQSCKCSCTVSLKDWMEWPWFSSTKLWVNFKYKSASIRSKPGF